MKNKKAFTLAETLIVLVVLGIVASITIPPLVRRQIEASNRVKIKKVMGVFDTLLAKIAVENDIKSTQALKEWGEQTDENGVGCVNQRKYFKAVKGEGCQFMTADKVWWDVTDITHPKIALKEGELNKPDSKTTFQLIAHFGPDGELRVNDIQWEIANNKDLTKEDKEELEKLWAYVNKSSNSFEKYNWADEFEKAKLTKCDTSDDIDAVIEEQGYTNTTYTSCYIGADMAGLPGGAFDSNGNLIIYGSTNEENKVDGAAQRYTNYYDTDNSELVALGYNTTAEGHLKYTDMQEGQWLGYNTELMDEYKEKQENGKYTHYIYTKKYIKNGNEYIEMSGCLKDYTNCQYCQVHNSTDQSICNKLKNSNT